MIKNKPEAYGISSDNLLCMVQELETFVEDIHSISVVCDNDVIFSKCIQPYTEEPMQMLHSFSKSMNSIAVGIAIDEGKLHLDDLVIDYFKEYLPEEYDKRIDQLTVRNLLTMAANSCRLSTCFRGVTDSWITHYFTYKLPHDPGTVFQYDTGASYMLSSLVTKTMHKNVLALMKERVLKPMGYYRYRMAGKPRRQYSRRMGVVFENTRHRENCNITCQYGKMERKNTYSGRIS